MSILMSSDDKVVIQGITGVAGRRQLSVYQDLGLPVAAGVSPGRGGRELEGVPVFDTVAEAVIEEGVTCSVVHAPPLRKAAAHAVMEAAEAGVRLVAVMTEGLPVSDTVEAIQHARRLNCRVIGPNGIGLLSPGECLLGMMPAPLALPGPVGLLSRSGSLVLEALRVLTGNQLGQSTAISMGGDPVIGTTPAEYLELFEQDAKTEAVVLVTEIGGTLDVGAADAIGTMMKPVVVLMVGRTAPKGRTMGHLGAIVDGTGSSIEAKEQRFRDAGAKVVATLFEVPDAVREVMS